jgi:hypothetical protein
MWIWILAGVGGLVLFILLLAVFGGPIAYGIGSTARMISPPRPLPTYPETPACIAARLAYEQAQRALDKQLAINKATQRQIDENEKRLKAQQKRLDKKQKQLFKKKRTP